MVNSASMQRGLFFVVLCFLLSPFLHAEEYPWQLKKDSDGIPVHVREVEGSPILEFKGTVVVDRPIKDVIDFYEQAERMPEWFHQCQESKLLETKSEDDKILYFSLDLPWPVKDRDAVYERVRTTDASTGVIEYHSSALPDYSPKHDGRVRMPMVKGFWRFTPLDAGRTEVYYQQHGDVGGHIPAWLVNQLAVNIPFNSLQHFRDHLTKTN